VRALDLDLLREVNRIRDGEEDTGEPVRILDRAQEAQNGGVQEMRRRTSGRYSSGKSTLDEARFALHAFGRIMDASLLHNVPEHTRDGSVAGRLLLLLAVVEMHADPGP
jgi:hypothetical protein